MPKVSIIIPVYNAQKTLTQCLDSIMALDFPKADREIIVVDNNSTDGSKEIILKYPVTYLFEEHRGRGWARNKGAKYAQTEFLAFIDADCVAQKDCLTKMLEAIESNDHIAICGGEIIAFKKEAILERYLEEKKILNQKKSIEGVWFADIPRVVTANSIFRRRILEEVGYFDEELITYEDTEISWRVSFFGYEIRYVPVAIVYHQHIRTFWTFCKHHFEYGVAAGVMEHKYRMFGFLMGPSLTFSQCLWLILRMFFKALIRIIKSDFPKTSRTTPFFDAVDFTRRMIFTWGMFFSTIGGLIQGRTSPIVSKVPLERYHKTFTFSQNGTRWLFDHRAAWFINDGIIKMVLFYDEPELIRFNGMGTKIWQNVYRTKDLDQTIDSIANEFNMTRAVVQNDVHEFIEMLSQENILCKTEKTEFAYDT